MKKLNEGWYEEKDPETSSLPYQINQLIKAVNQLIDERNNFLVYIDGNWFNQDGLVEKLPVSSSNPDTETPFALLQ